jgi:hypothetical protein
MSIATARSERPWCPADWREVELSQEEAAAALVAGQQAKWQSLKNTQYRWDISHPPKPRQYSAAELSEVMLARARQSGPYVLDAHNQAAWETLCAYFAAEPSEAGGKGLLLIGPVGCGKTTMLRLFGASNPRQKFGVVPARTVSSRFVSDGPDGLEPYLSAHYTGGVCFDDLGTEPSPVKHYGTECNALADVLEARYHEWESGLLRGDYTHLTTNLPVGSASDEPGAPTLYGRYGRRVGDRLRDLFQLVAFSPAAPSRRGA